MKKILLGFLLFGALFTFACKSEEQKEEEKREESRDKTRDSVLNNASNSDFLNAGPTPADSPNAGSPGDTADKK